MKKESIIKQTSEKGYIYDITPPDVITFIDKTFEIITKAYASIGGYKGASDKKRFLKSISLLRIITDKPFSIEELSNNQSNIIALEVFRNVENSFKSIALAKNIDIPNSGEFARKLIQYDIKNYEGLFWAEVSGAVEHLMKKYNGFPIPNTYAEEILNKNDLELDKDGIHYYRTIGLDSQEKFCKAIYGFKNKELLDKIINSVINVLGVAITYQEFRKYANELDDKNKQESYNSISVTKVLMNIFNEDKKIYTLNIINMAKNYIECVASASYEDDISEYPKDVIECLKLSINTLKHYGNKYSNSIKQGEDLLSFITPLEIHKF